MYYWNRVVTFIALIIISAIIFYYSKDSCPADLFACSSHGKCILKEELCNGNQLCPNGEDEDPVLCAEESGNVQVTDRYFNITLASDWQYHKKLNECDIENFPVQCRCKYSLRLFCQNFGLHFFPQNTSLSVTHLILTNTNLEKLPMNTFIDYQQVLVVHLENNALNNLPPGTFDGLVNLRKLYLMNNSLASISKGVFSELSNLQWLFLDNNVLEDVYLDDFKYLVSIEWITLSHNKLVFHGVTFPAMPNLFELFLDYNEMVVIEKNTFGNLSNLELLSLKNNKIESINEQAFDNLRNLKELDLQGNHLKSLPSSLFSNQLALSRLYIGNNPFEYLPLDIFKSLYNLSYLNLENIEIRNIHTRMFSSLVSLESIYFKKYSYCHYVSSVERCRPLSDGVSSNAQLLYKPIFQYTNWIICIATCAGNIMVLFGRYIFQDENKVLSLIIKNLAVSDLLMGIYLLIIGIHDLKYRNVYYLEAQNWISSWDCTITGIIAMISCEVSVLLLVFMSVDRFLIIAIPYGKYSALTMREAIIALLFIWCLGIILAVFPALAYISSTRFYGVNGLCFPLHIDDPYSTGWEYSVVIFFGINATGLIIIAFVYIGMFISIWRTRNATNLPAKDYNFAIRFFFIVLTDVTCWLPIVIIKAAAFLGAAVSGDLYGWLVVFILPINSALNPILYTFTTPKYRTHIIKKVPSLIKEVANLSKNNGSRICTRNQICVGEIDHLKLTCTKESNLNKPNVKIVLNKF